MKLLSAALSLALTLPISSTTMAADSIWVYLGTYTRDTDSEGIYRCELDLETGTLSPPELVAEADSPSYLAASADGSVLYAVEETGDFGGASSGAMRSFAINRSSGDLTPGGAAPTGGAAPCHLAVDPSGRHVFYANYTGGSAGAFAAGEKGKLGPRTAFSQHKGSSIDPARQTAPHAHGVALDPAGRFAFVADLGLDQLVAYRYDSGTGSLFPHDPPFAEVKAGGGPRHMVFRPDGKFAYTNLEMASEVAAYSYDASKGLLSNASTTSSLPAGHAGAGNSTAAIAVHPSGRFLYVSNRGHDSIARFAIDPATGALKPEGHTPSGGRTPRGFAIDPTGRYLVAGNENSANVVVFRIDPATGALSPTGSEAQVAKPVCVEFVRPSAGTFKALFDGKTLEGWNGKQEWFRVEDGCVVAGKLDRPIPNNEFLVTDAEFGDFELRFEAKLVGDGNNAGVQFWSQRIPDHHEMIGFQCDIGDMRGTSIWGALYDESRRKRFLSQVPVPVQQITAQKNEWNQFRVLARGDSITIWVNGGLATHYYETEPAEGVPRKGRIGLQVHSGKALEAWYRKIELRSL